MRQTRSTANSSAFFSFESFPSDGIALHTKNFTMSAWVSSVNDLNTETWGEATSKYYTALLKANKNATWADAQQQMSAKYKRYKRLRRSNPDVRPCEPIFERDNGKECIRVVGKIDPSQKGFYGKLPGAASLASSARSASPKSKPKKKTKTQAVSHSTAAHHLLSPKPSRPASSKSKTNINIVANARLTDARVTATLQNLQDQLQKGVGAQGANINVVLNDCCGDKVSPSGAAQNNASMPKQPSPTFPPSSSIQVPKKATDDSQRYAKLHQGVWRVSPENAGSAATNAAA